MANPALRLALALPLVLAPGVLACDGEGDEHHDEHADHEEGDEVDCAAEDRADEFMVGLSKSGASVAVTFVSADPAPPIKGDNTWVVTVSDPGGGPLEGVNITEVVPTMPDHGHGTPVEAVASATGNPGEFELTPVNLFMAGLWEIELKIELDQGQDSDEVTFAFCVE